MAKIMSPANIYQCVNLHTLHICQKNNMKNSQSESTQITRHGLRTFGLLALIVFFFPIYYCYATSHFMETGILSIVVAGLGILISSMYHSTDTNLKSYTHDTPSESPLRHRAVGIHDGAH